MPQSAVFPLGIVFYLFGDVLFQIFQDYSHAAQLLVNSILLLSILAVSIAELYLWRALTSYHSVGVLHFARIRRGVSSVALSFSSERILRPCRSQI